MSKIDHVNESALDSRNAELLTTFPPDDSPDGDGVHTFSIVDVGDRYLGYAGPVHAGSIDLWESNDLHEWTSVTHDLLPGKSRWPTAVYESGVVSLIVSRPMGDLSRKLGEATSLRGRLPALVGDRSTYRLECWQSSDGRDFERSQIVVDAADTGLRTNRNPNLFRDPGGQLGLVYYAGQDGEYQIRYRESETVAGLAATSDHVLAQSDSVLAAPTMAHHDGQYYLLTEAVENGKWITEAYPIDTPTTPIDIDDREVIFSDQEACPFPFREGDDLYLFTSRALNSVTPPGIDGQWEGRIYKYGSEKGDMNGNKELDNNDG